MTAYVAIADSDIDPESPLTATLMTRIRDNPIAITEGSSGAPKIQTAGIQDNAVTGAKLTAAIAGNYLTLPPPVYYGGVYDGGGPKFVSSLPVLDGGGGASITPQKIYEGIIPRSGTYRTIIRHVFYSLSLSGNNNCAIYRNGTLVQDNTIATSISIGNEVTSYFSNDTSGWSAGDLIQVYVWLDNAGGNPDVFVKMLILEGLPIVPSYPYTYYYAAGAW